MALQDFYTGLADTDLAKDAIYNQAKLYIQKYVYIGSGVLDKTTPASSTLTPATSPAWTIDELVSTVAGNLIVLDDNGKAATGMVKDNIATALTFDATALLLDEDGTTAASLTTAKTYDFYVLTPSSTAGNVYGPFWGLTEGVELNISQAYSDFKYGKPRKTLWRDLEEVSGSLAGGHINWTDPDVLQSIFTAVQYGDNSPGTSYAIGSANACGASGNYYRLAFKTTDKNCRDIWIVVRKVQFNADGNIFGESESGLSMVNFSAMILADGFYPETADMIQIIRGA